MSVFASRPRAAVGSCTRELQGVGSRRWLAVLACLLSLAGCQQGPPKVEYEYIYRTGAKAVAVAAGGAVAALSLDGAPSLGPADAKVTIIESSDFQCPFCSKGATTMKELVAQYPSDVRLVFVNNPLSFHKEAVPAAKAALAAHAQGKFWEYHDLLFTTKRYDEASLEGFAQQLGLDMAKWNADRASEAVARRIQHDQAAVTSLGARGTPAFFVNGTLVSGAQPISKFQAEVNKAIEEANGALAQGIKPGDLHRHLAGKNAGAGFVDSIIDGKPASAAAAPPARPDDRGQAGADRGAPPAPTGPVEVKVREEDAFKGGKSAKITVVEFSDFQCPFCSKVGPTLKQIEDAYGDKVKIVFKHMPLAFHKDAKPAAMAAVAAQRQGKFWEYHDLLFQNQKALTRPDLDRYAEQLGLDMAKFRADFDDPKTAAQVDQDMADAQAAGVRGTPTSFVNGNIVKGASPFPAFQAVIDRELGGGTAQPAGGAGMPAAGNVLDTAVVSVNPALGVSQGNAEAATTLVVATEPLAPANGDLLGHVERLVRERGANTRIVVQLAPPAGDERARRVAEAFHAAAKATPERAFRLLRVLHRATEELTDAKVLELANRAGIDEAGFKAALADKATADAVEAASKAVRAFGAPSLPVVYVNGRRVTASPMDAETLGRALSEASSR